MSTKVVSLLEKKEIREREYKEQLTKPLCDFYIPLAEQRFWKEVADRVANLKVDFMPDIYKEYRDYVEDFIIAFPIDIEMYSDFATELKNFRFIFNNIELQILYDVINNLNDVKTIKTTYSKELNHYSKFLKSKLSIFIKVDKTP